MLATCFAPTFCTKLDIVSADSSKLNRFEGLFTGTYLNSLFIGDELTILIWKQNNTVKNTFGGPGITFSQLFVYFPTM